MSLVFILLTLVFAGRIILDARTVRAREMGRFAVVAPTNESTNEQWHDEFHDRYLNDDDEQRVRDLEIASKVRRAGLDRASTESIWCQGATWYALAIVAGVSSFYLGSVHSAALTIIGVLGCAFLVPGVVRQREFLERRREMHSGFASLFSLLQMGLASGEEVGPCARRVIRQLHGNQPDSLPWGELLACAWLSENGYTWREALARMERRIADEELTDQIHGLIAVMHGDVEEGDLEEMQRSAWQARLSPVQKNGQGLALRVALLSVAVLIAIAALISSPIVYQLLRTLP